MSQSVPTSSHAQNLTGQTVNYFGPVLKGAEKGVRTSQPFNWLRVLQTVLTSCSL